MLLSDSVEPKFVTKIDQKNDLSDGQYPVNKNIRLNPYANTTSA